MNTREKTIWQILNVYMPFNTPKEETEGGFLQKMFEKIENWRKRWATDKTRFIAIGDFNRIYNGELDRTTEEERGKDEKFKETLDTLNWIDIYRLCNGDKREFTRKRGYTEMEARIDLAFSKDIGWKEAGIKDTAKYKTAHRYITVTTSGHRFKKEKPPELKRWDLSNEGKNTQFVNRMKEIKTRGAMELIREVTKAANETLPIFREKKIKDITEDEGTKRLEEEIQTELDKNTRGEPIDDEGVKEKKKALGKRRNELLREYAKKKKERVEADKTTKALFAQCNWENPMLFIWHLKREGEGDERDLKKRVEEGFKKYFKRQEIEGNKVDIPDRGAAKIRNLCTLREVGKDEVRKIIQDTKDNTPGKDRITNGMWKMVPENVVEAIVEIVNGVIRGEGWPVGLKVMQILPLPKVTNPLTALNYRPIGLLFTLQKIITSALDRQVRAHCKKHGIISPSQQAYQKGCNTANHGRVTKNLMEDARRNGKTLWVLSIDKENAYGTMDHERALEVLKILGFDEKFIAIIRDLYKNFKAEVITGRGVTEQFKIEAGAVQGDPLSCILFILSNSEPIMRAVEGSKYGYVSKTLPTSGKVAIASFCDDDQLFENELRRIGKLLG